MKWITIYIVLVMLSMTDATRAYGDDVLAGTDISNAPAAHIWEEDRSPSDCGGHGWFIPLGERDSGMGVWRDSRTGDVLIRGNMPDAQGGKGRDMPLCPEGASGRGRFADDPGEP